MHQYFGKCGCGNVVVQFSSRKEISSYTSRKCDCDYCMQRGIEYLSDPHSQITLIAKTPLKQEKQGSEQATFLLCAKCQNVVGVGYLNEGVSVGSLNVRLLDEFDHLQKSVVVSPKTLGKTQKVRRWRELWSQLFAK